MEPKARICGQPSIPIGNYTHYQKRVRATLDTALGYIQH